MEIATPRSCMLQVVERKKSAELKICETTFCILHPASCRRNVTKEKYAETKTCAMTFQILHPANGTNKDFYQKTQLFS